VYTTVYWYYKLNNYGPLFITKIANYQLHLKALSTKTIVQVPTPMHTYKWKICSFWVLFTILLCIQTQRYTSTDCNGTEHTRRY